MSITKVDYIFVVSFEVEGVEYVFMGVNKKSVLSDAYATMREVVK